MKWFSTKDRLPTDQQEVLIKYRGIVNLARYLADEQGFLLRNGEALSIHRETIDWMQLVSPMQEK